MTVKSVTEASVIVETPKKAPAKKTKAAKVAKETLFRPTQNEEWTKKPVSFNFVQRTFYNTAIFSVLKLRVQPKMEAKAWERIETLELSSLKTVGDIEVFALSILEETKPKDPTKIRNKLTVALKAYATEGLIKAAPTFVALIKEP